MSSERELDEGIKSIKSAWRREHTARTNLKRMLEQAEAENEKLGKRLAQYELFSEVVGDPAHEFANLRRELHRVERENAQLRELILDMLVDEERGHNDDDTYYEHVRLAKELGIEVD